MTVRLRPDQRDALEELAEQERQERERETPRRAKRLDISTVLRAIIDKALRLKPPKE